MQGSLFCDWTDRQLADCHHPSQHTQAIQPKVCSELHQTVKTPVEHVLITMVQIVEIQLEDRIILLMLKTNFKYLLSQTSGLLEAQRMWEVRTILAQT